MKIVALDLPTSHMMLKADDPWTGRMFDAVYEMLLAMLAAIARKDYDDRRRRQAQGKVKAKAEGRLRGRPENAKRNNAIIAHLKNGQSWTSIIEATGCSRSTLAKLAKRVGSGSRGPDAVHFAYRFSLAGLYGLPYTEKE